MKTDIPKLIETLIDRLHIEQIFLWTYARDGKKLRILHIHLIPESGMRFGEAKEICNTLFERYPEINFTLYYRHEVQQLIDQGLGRFILVCQPENKIYQSDITAEDIILPETTSDRIAEKCRQYIVAEESKPHSFLEGYHFYYNNSNYPHAAFMLHQAIELTLRSILLLLVGYEKKSHCLVNNIAHLKIYDSVLGRLSIKDKDMIALRQLDDSYSAFRYNQGFQIDKKHLEAAYGIIERIQSWITSYQPAYLQEIKQQLDPDRRLQKQIELRKEKYHENVSQMDSTDHRGLILAALDVYEAVRLVKCFACRNSGGQLSNPLLMVDNSSTVHHYYLFIGVDLEQIHTLDLQQKVHQLLPAHIRVTFIIENIHTVTKKAQRRHFFFANILQHAETWSGDSTIIPAWHLPLPIPHRRTTALQQLWSRRLQNAYMLSAMHHSAYCIGAERAICFGLAAATEQICLGLIKLLMGYSPQVVNLHYLMSLIDVILPQASASFYRERKADSNLFKLLSEAQREFRHSPNYNISETEVDTLHERVQDFIRMACSYVDSHFENQDNSHKDTADEIQVKDISYV